MVPQAPLKGVAGLPGSPERWDVLLSSGKEPGLDTGTLGVWSQEIREGVFQAPRVSRVGGDAGVLGEARWSHGLAKGQRPCGQPLLSSERAGSFISQQRSWGAEVV